MGLTFKMKKMGLRHLFSILFVLAITLPALLALTGLAGSAPKAGKPPALHWRYLLASEYYSAWGQYIDQHLAPIGPLTKAMRWLDYRLFKTSDRPEVYVGRDGWLFASRDIDIYRRDACSEKDRAHQLVFELNTIAHLIEASGRRFLFTVAPAKSTIYPEFVGSIPKEPACGRSMYELFLEAQKGHHLTCFVRLDDTLLAAKAEDQLLYAKTGATWNGNGAAIAARALKNAILTGVDRPGAVQTDLAEVLLEGPGSQGQPATDAGSFQLSSAVVYGGAAINALLPYLAQPFSRTDAILSDTIPSANHGENLSAYDTIAVIVDEGRLPDLRFDFDGLCRMLSMDSIADDQKSVPLKTCAPESRLALSWEENRLAVKSLGAGGFFRLPPLPGSDADTLRILTMDITAPAADDLVWEMVQPPHRTAAKSIGAGTSRLYLPLPVQSSLNLRINPGRSMGMFFFSNAKLLAYNNGIFSLAPAASNGTRPAVGDQAATEPRAEGPPTPVQKPQPQTPMVHATPPPDIIINDFADFRVFQRSGVVADVIISGTYSGPPQAVEARIVRHSNAAPVTPWRIIDSSPGNGVFMGIMAEVPQGGWYRLQARFAHHPQNVHQGESRWGVGVLVACIGQSNMKEMFYTGNDLSPHSILSLYRRGRWQPMGQKGDGAIALGNRLIGKLGVPVGLLDYAVNGSGLRQEADWGAGYWADRSDQGIFATFAKDVAATGGALEYVVWMQGEADAARGTISGSQYRNALCAFIEQQIRPAFANASQLAHLPFLIVGMARRPGGRDAAHQEIRDAMLSVTRDVPDCHMAATTLDLETRGRQHLVPGAYATIGLRVAQTILYLLGEENYYRGPGIIGAQRVDADTIQIDLAHQGGYDFSPASGITGWLASSNGVRIPISDVWRHDSRSVRLKLDRVIEGPLTLEYLFGAAPAAEGAIHDNSTLELPLEPGRVDLE